jgi:hypothetical protein
MPCGGVGTCEIPPDSPGNRCFFCNRGGCGHFYKEFDAYIHARCFLSDLQRNPEGEASIAISHEHRIYLDTGNDESPLQAGRVI